MFGKPWTEVVADCTIKTDSGGEIATLRCLPAVFQNIITFALLASGIVAVIFIIWAGAKMVTSGGDQKRIDSARKTLTWAIIGLIIVLMSFFIVNTIGVLTDTEDCLNEISFSNKNC